MDFSKYNIKRVSRAECEQILSKNHYLSKQGFSFRCGRNYGLFLKDKLIGVAIFHTVCGDDNCYLHTEQDGSAVCIDNDALDNEYEE